MNSHHIKDRTVAVSTEVCWLPIDDKTPLGVKMLLINRLQGIAVISIRREQDCWTHWFPVPHFAEEDHEHK